MFVRFFWFPEEPETTENSLHLCVRIRFVRDGKRYFGGVLGDFSPFFRGFFPIVWRRTENQSKPNEKSFSWDWKIKVSQTEFLGAWNRILASVFRYLNELCMQKRKSMMSFLFLFLCHGWSAVARFCGGCGDGCHRKAVTSFPFVFPSVRVDGVFSSGIRDGREYSILARTVWQNC